MRTENCLAFGNAEDIGDFVNRGSMQWHRWKPYWVRAKRIWERRKCRQQLQTYFCKKFFYDLQRKEVLSGGG